MQPPKERNAQAAEVTEGELGVLLVQVTEENLTLTYGFFTPMC